MHAVQKQEIPLDLFGQLFTGTLFTVPPFPQAFVLREAALLCTINSLFLCAAVCFLKPKSRYALFTWQNPIRHETQQYPQNDRKEACL